MPTPSFRALLVDANPADALHVTKLLASVRGPAQELGPFGVDSVDCLEQALRVLGQGGHDVVLLDLSLPDSRGLQTLRAVRRVTRVPIVILSGIADVHLALETLTLGAQDFLSRNDLQPELITRTLRFAIERRRAEEQLETAVRNKEALLRELHHRAKNNLQVISSLLSMQARRSRDARFGQLVSAAQERIATIAAAHEELHRSPDLGRIDLSAYLSRLARAAHRAYGAGTRDLALALDAGALELPLDQAVATGLLVNELVTNAFKHAFPDERQGTVRLTLAGNAGRVTLTVEDDGVGLPPGALVEARTLGLELVATVAEQLDATLEHEPARGTRIRLRFPHSKECA